MWATPRSQSFALVGSAGLSPQLGEDVRGRDEAGGGLRQPRPRRDHPSTAASSRRARSLIGGSDAASASDTYLAEQRKRSEDERPPRAA